MHNYVIIRHIWQFLRSVGQSTSSYTDVPSFSSTCSSFEAEREREKRFKMVMYTVWLFNRVVNEGRMCESRGEDGMMCLKLDG